jgi:hypothetical protein
MCRTRHCRHREIVIASLSFTRWVTGDGWRPGLSINKHNQGAPSMSTPDAKTIETFLRLQYRLWSEGKFEEMLAAFREIAPNGLTIEYVGKEPRDGWQELDEMWAQYGNKCPTEVVLLLVNGNEAATHILNHMQTDNGVVSVPSLETYKFGDGTLHVRYYHQA